jgi:hypothetical protein
MAVGVLVRPFTARGFPVLFVEFTEYFGSYIVAPVVELFLDLVFDELAFFLHHQNLFQAGGKFARRM